MSNVSLRPRSECAEKMAKPRGAEFLARLGKSSRESMRFRPVLEALEDRRLMAADFGSRGKDVILEWNAVMLQADANDHARTSPQQGGPVLAGRAFAIVSAAMYDAYNSIEKIGEAYLVTAPPTKHANSDAAVAQAAHDTLVALYPGQTAAFDKALKQTLERVRNGRSEDNGRKVGAFVAERLLAARADDGTVEIMQPAYVPNGLAGFHDVDPLHPGQGFYAAGAMNVDPFAISSLEDFPARQLDDGTPAGRAAFLQSDEYTRAYEEVMTLGGDGDTTSTERTAEQTVIGIYWAYDGRPGLGTPPRLYNQIVRTIADKKDNTEAENARLFALVNIAMADAGLASWNDKYDLAFWRPILGIRNGDADGNVATTGDADWRPLGASASNPRPGETDFTPPFPACTSGHATFGAAAFQMLARFYGRDDISFRFVSDEFNGKTRDDDGTVRPRIVRSFDSFTEAKRENGQSRIYLGIHWAFDRDEGIKQGDAVANSVYDTILKPSSGHHHDHDSHDNQLIAGSTGVSNLAASSSGENKPVLVSFQAHTPATPATAGSLDVLASPGEGRGRSFKSGSKSTGGDSALSGDGEWTAAVDSLFAD